MGDGTNGGRKELVEIVSSGVTSVSGGRSHSLYIKSDGSLWAMGYNNYGQLGDGTTIDRNSPVQILSSGVTSVSGGRHHSLFIKSDGSL